jgi:hypothetical protein
MLASLLLFTAWPAAAFIPVQTYYVPLPEDELLSSFGDRIAGCGRSCSTPRSPIRTLISIVVSADGTQILYDHHEDGFECDPSNPTGLKPGGSTEIWGDGDLSNGVAPGDPNDLLDAGVVISLDTDVSVPSGAIFFDGADKVVASFPVVMTRAAIPTGPGALQAGAMEASPIERWGRSYVWRPWASTPATAAACSSTTRFMSWRARTTPSATSTRTLTAPASAGRAPRPSMRARP